MAYVHSNPAMWFRYEELMLQVPMMLPQSQEWGVSLIDVTRSLTGNTFVS